MLRASFSKELLSLRDSSRNQLFVESLVGFDECGIGRDLSGMTDDAAGAMARFIVWFQIQRLIPGSCDSFELVNADEFINLLSKLMGVSITWDDICCLMVDMGFLDNRYLVTYKDSALISFDIEALILEKMRVMADSICDDDSAIDDDIDTSSDVALVVPEDDIDDVSTTIDIPEYDSTTTFLPLVDERLEPVLDNLTWQFVKTVDGHIDKRHIVFATDGYTGDDGKPMLASDEIDGDWLQRYGKNQILRRCDKLDVVRSKRQESMAEVFTPIDMVREMVDLMGNPWHMSGSLAKMPSFERTLDVACGEGAFLTTRYDMATGEEIPMTNRCGILDRKLAVLRECAHLVSKENLYKPFKSVLSTTCGVEYQGDNLILARSMVFLSWYETYVSVFGQRPRMSLQKRICDVICQTIIQADYITGCLFDSNDLSLFGLRLLASTSSVVSYYTVDGLLVTENIVESEQENN